MIERVAAKKMYSREKIIQKYKFSNYLIHMSTRYSDGATFTRHQSIYSCTKLGYLMQGPLNQDSTDTNEYLFGQF